MKRVCVVILTLIQLPCSADPSQLPGRSFIEKHCLDCHDSEIAKGGLDLTKIGFDLNDEGVLQRWVRIHDRVRDGEMPPAKKPRPADVEIQTFIAAVSQPLKNHVVQKQKALGRVRARRLTRFEYERTLQDLLGIDIPLQELLPEDARTDGFDTVAEGQQVSHYLLAKYLAAVDLALETSFARALGAERPFLKEWSWQNIARKKPKGREPERRKNDAVAWSTQQPFHGRMPATMVRESGWYRIRLRASAVNPKGRSVWSMIRSGECAARAPLMFWIGSFEARKQPQDFTFEAWIHEKHMVEVRPGDRTLRVVGAKVFEVDGRAERALVPGVAIHSVSLERIHRGPSQSESRKMLFGDLAVDTMPDGPSKVVTSEPTEDLETLMTSFARRAFRRNVSMEVLQPYIDLALKAMKQDGNFVDALMGGYRSLLCSPRFLYFQESPGALADFALASRLSYFLWKTMPDSELMELAESGSLRDPATLSTQVERLLNDPRSAAFVENFTAQWLQLSEIDFTTPDAALYPEFDEILKHAMLDETHLFFAELLRKDLSVTHIVDSDFTMVNERLARHYGIPSPPSDAVERVSLKPANRRGGFITQSSVLKVTANGTTTSPVLRGVWMMERIMGEHVAPPPPNVPAIEPDIRGATNIRDQLDKHRNNKSCAVCHVKIDPPGFALESYDVIGGWRERYRAKGGGKGGKRWRPGQPVDPSYTLPDGRSFKDIAGFKKLLLAEPDKLARNMAEKLVTYATGRGISFADREEIENIVEQVRAKNFGLRSLVHAVAASSLFQCK